MSERMRYWQRRVAELESSGLSRAAFCRRHRINYQTMSSWVKRLRDKSGLASGSSDAAGFIEVSLPAESGLAGSALAAVPAGYEVCLEGGWSIRVGGDFDGEVLARLIRVVESC